MTQKQKDKYIENGGVYCPFCRTIDIESGPLEHDDIAISANVKCNQCGRQWRDTYKIVSVTEIKP